MAPEGVQFRVWAPGQRRLQLEIEGRGKPRELLAREAGWFEVTVADARVGDRYRFVLDDGAKIPDPASRYQPDDVHGASEVIDPFAYEWQASAWQGRPWEEAVIYELHIGAFTPEGTFRAAIDKLDHLVQLGITVVEIMPVADFPGQRNWGYDGVLLYAPDSTYGRPEGFKSLIDAAHARGLMVLLDVVYNHFGPEGNYLPTLAPPIFTERHHTPWGAAINYDDYDSRPDSRPVRELIIHNALYWIEEFNLDGLRLDAVHSIIDESDEHLLTELARRVRGLAPDRCVHLLLENERNEASRLTRSASGAPVHYTAQWNDDVHHALHVAATSESSGYYQDYLNDTKRLARALAEGFAFQGERMRFSGESRGEPSAHLPPPAFVSFIQNHDQIGNRAFGERIGALAEPHVARAVAAAYLLAPQIPMLFMGEEWNAQQPFLFFCDFGGELAEAVRRGRREEFGRFPEFKDPQKRDRIPDPLSAETFAATKLQWSDVRLPRHAACLDWYQRVLAVRRHCIVPILGRIKQGGAYEIVGDGAVLVRWRCGDGESLTLAANLSNSAEAFPACSGNLVWHEGPGLSGDTLAAWTVRWLITREDA